VRPRAAESDPGTVSTRVVPAPLVGTAVADVAGRLASPALLVAAGAVVLADGDTGAVLGAATEVDVAGFDIPASAGSVRPHPTADASTETSTRPAEVVASAFPVVHGPSRRTARSRSGRSRSGRGWACS
jgi:hypothetical protein